MKKILPILVCFLMLCLTSCQKEENTIIQDPANNLSNASSLTTLLARVAQNNTAIDNIIDNTSVFKVNFPYQITVNNQSLTIDAVADYATVAALLTASATDDDNIVFTFPISVSFRNYTTRILNSQSSLQEALDDDDDLSEISCFSINYPISITLYDSNNQVGDTVTIDGNEEWATFLLGLANNVFFVINYPISITNQNGIMQSISNNDQLENAINQAAAVCGANSGNPDGLEEILVQGNWFVSLYQDDDDDDDDDTSDFQGYTFTFNADNTITISFNATTSSGTWQIINDGGDIKLDLTFTDSNLQELTDDWELIEFANSLIRLKDDNENEFLNFSRL